MTYFVDHRDHDINLPSLAHVPSSASDDSQLKCNICDKNFSKISNRRTYENNFYGVSLQYANTATICNNCSLTYPSSILKASGVVEF